MKNKQLRISVGVLSTRSSSQYSPDAISSFDPLVNCPPLSAKRPCPRVHPNGLTRRRESAPWERIYKRYQVFAG